jgi:geranylgeranylglycerol-phosphate geranylgeranyltransferase
MVSIVVTSIVSYHEKNIFPLVILIISLFLISAYEIGLKKAGIPGNVSVAVLTGLPFLFGSSLVRGLQPVVLSISAMAALVNLSREIMKDLEDMEGDRGYRVTIPMRIGGQMSRYISLLFCIVAVSTSIVIIPLFGYNPAYVILVIVADILFISSNIIPGIAPRSSQLMLKTGMITASIAFLSILMF